MAISNFRPGQVVRVPIIPEPKAFQNYDLNSYPTIMEYDEIYYDPQTMTHKTLRSEREKQELQKQIDDMKNQKKKDLQNLIGYFYKR